jgi:hypothetical protein
MYTYLLDVLDDLLEMTDGKWEAKTNELANNRRSYARLLTLSFYVQSRAETYILQGL